MSRDTESTPVNSAGILNHTELILFLKDPEKVQVDRAGHYVSQFACVTAVTLFDDPISLPEGVTRIKADPGRSRADIWNERVRESSRKWVFILEEDELLFVESIPGGNIISETNWPAVRLEQQTDEQTSFQAYQLRMVPGGINHLFEGKNLPDCTQYIFEHEISLCEQVIEVRKTGSEMYDADFEDELSVSGASPQVYLMQGEKLFKKRKYHQAAAQYRHVLKMVQLLPFDRLGAVNGLAGCFTEQFKWDKALSLCETAVAAEPLQRIPYLIQYRIRQLNKEWKAAFDILESYYSQLHKPSRANFDKALHEKETLVQLADLALKAQLKQKARDYYEQIYSMNGGEADRDFLKRLLLLSVELENRDKSVYFFEQMFRADIPDGLSMRGKSELNDYLELFMKRGWYDYAGSIYEKLYRAEPENAEYRRRLIVTFSKTNKIEKARKLITGNI